MSTRAKCQAGDLQVKDGFTRVGSQHIRCMRCGHRFTSVRKPRGYPPDVCNIRC